MVVILLFIGVVVQPAIAIVQPEKIVIESDVDDVEGLVAELRIVINEILHKYGHIPMIRTQCYKIIDVLNSFKILINCILIIILAIPLIIIVFSMLVLLIVENYLFQNLFYLLVAMLAYFDVNCRGNYLPFKSLSNINRIVASDSSSLTEIDVCPCMKE